MKQLLLFAIFLFITFNSYSQNQLVINGKVDGITDGTIYLYNWTGEKPLKIDSATISGGTFSFNKTISLPAVYFLTIVKSKTPIFLFPDTEPMSVSLQFDPLNGKVNSFTVSGGTTQKAYSTYSQAYKNLYDDYMKLMSDYDKARIDKNDAAMKNQNEKMLAKEKAMSDLELKMIDDNSDNILSLFFICNKYQKTDPGTAKAKLAKVSNHLQSSELYKHLNK